MDAVHTILVATDFSNISDYALECAVELAKVHGAKHITVLHAYEVPSYAFPDGTMVSVVDLAAKIREAAQASLTHACESHAVDHVHMTPLLCEGPIWDHVSRVAREINAQLIVIGTHGRKGLAYKHLGSAAEKILQATTRPVIVVRPPHADM